MARPLVQMGHQVTLVVTAEDRRFGVVESSWEGARVIETPDLLWGRLRSGWDLWCLMNRMIVVGRDRHLYDLVHCFETRPATIYPALLYCTRHGVPMITDWNDWWGRGGIIDEIRPKWYRALFGGIEAYYEEAFRMRGAGLTVISGGLAKRAAALGVPAERILHLPGGTFPELFQARSKESCRRRVGLPLSIPVLGFSSLDSHLDFEMVIQTLAIIAGKYPSVKLMVTGDVGKRVRNLVREHHVEDSVHFTGLLSAQELPWHLGCADVFVLPFPDKVYNRGRWPNKIGDYMSLGRPTVCNPVGDMKQLFENNDIGLLAEWDAVDFSQKIIYLIEHPRIADGLGEEARRLAVKRYDWRILARGLEEFYYRVLNTEDRPTT